MLRNIIYNTYKYLCVRQKQNQKQPLPQKETVRTVGKVQVIKTVSLYLDWFKLKYEEAVRNDWGMRTSEWEGEDDRTN